MKKVSSILLAAAMLVPGMPVSAAQVSQNDTEEIAPHLFGEITTVW